MDFFKRNIIMCNRNKYYNECLCVCCHCLCLQSPMQIGHLSSPYTLMETVTLLYSDLPSRDLILTTTEMLGQPMVTLWQNVLERYIPM